MSLGLGACPIRISGELFQQGVQYSPDFAVDSGVAGLIRNLDSLCFCLDSMILWTHLTSKIQALTETNQNNLPTSKRQHVFSSLIGWNRHERSAAET